MTTNQRPTNLIKVESLEARGIVKRFPGVLANDRIDFDVRAGEVHSLLGENGAGKSTLMKILYGMYQPDEGEILVDGKVVRIRSPLDAMSHGIGMVHQHFMLVPTLTVTENVALGLPSSRKVLLDLDVVARRIEKLAELYHLQIDPKAPVWQLSVGEQQRVEILKVLYRGASVLILDEPTAVLTPQEVDGLFKTLHKMVDEGHALVFISHKLWEVMALSNRVTVLHTGRVVGKLPIEEADEKKLASMMVGREFLMRVDHPEVELGEVKLELKGIRALGESGLEALKGVDLKVRAGEILGLAGVSGNGQRDLAEVIAGLRTPTEGEVIMDGRDVTGWKPAELLEHGLSYIPEARMIDGTVGDFSVSENLIMKDHIYKPYADGIFMNFKNIEKENERLVETFDIKTPSIATPIKNLSGGNIQKLILAREISRGPRVLVAAQPTRGLDIRATEYIRRRITEQREKGVTTLLISEDLDEILSLSDRIAVIFEGEIMGVVDRDDATFENLGLMMGGKKKTDIS